MAYFLRAGIGRRFTQRFVVAVLWLCTPAFLFPALASEAGAADERAAEIAQKTLDAMGGAEAWAQTRFLRFEFFGFRLHHWDRHDGRHRLEGKTRDGDSYVVLSDLHTREGRAWLNGEPLSGEELDSWLERAWSAWVNDTYWLLMPYKLRDPGVHLTYDGEDTLDGKTYDKLRLTFDGVGLTPGDTYWAWIDRETGLMHQWAYVLQDWEEGKEATRWHWLDWQRYGQVMLASKRVNPDGGREAELGKLAVFDHLPDAVFDSPEAPAAAETAEAAEAADP